MKISSNYNLSFNQKVNNQQSKTNPNFGINAKNLTLPIAAGTGAIYGVAHKLMPFSADIFLSVSDKPASENKNSGLTDLPADENGYTYLHYLCKEGNFNAVKKFLDENPNINLSQRNKFDYTYMSIAANSKKKEIMNLIAGMDKYNPATTDKNGWTDFHRLCENGYTDAVKTLLEKHPEFDINQKTKYGYTCMYLAIYNEQEDTINLIAGMDKYNPAIPDEDGYTDLHRLCEKGYTDAVKTLLEKHPEFDINQQTNRGDTCMSLAIGNKQNDIINLIAGMDKYNPAIPNKNGWTDLHRLCEKGYADVVKTLLEKHPEIDINQKSKDGKTCMFLAMDNNRVDIINLIAGMDKYNPAIPIKNGWTDLHSFCFSGDTDIIKTLLKKHPDIDFNQQNTYTPNCTCMSNALSRDNEDIVNLIANTDNYNPAIPDADGLTDLHRLCEKGRTDVVKILLEKHPEIDFSLQTKDGNTCMSLAIDNEHEDIINLIAGTDNYKPDIPDKDGRTDLHKLCDSNYTEIIEKIIKNKPDVNINQLSNDGYSCMTIAIVNGNNDLVNLIAGLKNYNPLIINKFGANDLHYLCRGGYTEAVKTILDNNPDINLNQLTKNGLSYIDLAKLNNHTDIVKIISDRL